MPNTPYGFVRVFLPGALGAFACFAAVPVVKFVFRRLTGEQYEDDDTEE